jgi:serine/threonine protein kinase
VRPGHRAQIKREIATLKLLKHPNVVRLYEVKLLSYPPSRLLSCRRVEEGEG